MTFVRARDDVWEGSGRHAGGLGMTCDRARGDIGGRDGVAVVAVKEGRIVATVFRRRKWVD